MSNQQPQVGYVVNSGALVNPGGAQGPGGAGDSAMVGVIQMYPSLTPPAGWMIADGSAISRTTYAALYSLIGTAFGVGDGATTFNLPDMRSRVPLGSGQGTGLTNRTLAATGGEEAHALSVGEEAPHTHGMDHYHNWGAQGSHSHSDSGHSHPQSAVSGAGATLAGGATYLVQNINTGTGNAAISAAATPAGNTQYASQASAGWANTASTGSGTPHNTMPPFVVVCFIIKVSQTVPLGASAPLADTTQPGYLVKVSGLTTDYIGGDNQTHPLPAFPTSGFISKSAAYTLTPADNNKYVICSGGSWTLSLPAPAVSYVWNVRNDQGLVASGTITIQPASGTIDGKASLALLPGQQCTLYCDGTNWRSFGLQRDIVIGTQDITSAVANAVVLLPVGYRQFELEWNGMICSATGPVALYGYFSTDGGNTWLTGGSYYWEYYYTNTATTVGAGTGNASTQAYLGWGMDPAARGHAKTFLCPGGLNRDPSWLSHGAGYSAGFGAGAQMTVSGFYNAANVQINALQYFFSSGNINQSYLTVKGIV